MEKPHGLDWLVVLWARCESVAYYTGIINHYYYFLPDGVY